MLSLDLSRAYDKLPRDKLEQSLLRIHAPADLITLIRYIHDHAHMVIEKHGHVTGVRLGRGIRQGCGLSPLLWLAFTLLLHDQFRSYLPDDVVTGYADDYEMQWEFQHASDFRNACIHVERILHDLKAAGMEVAKDKTVIMLALKGTAAAALLRDFTVRKEGRRFLRIQGMNSTTMLPIKESHTYLGVKIGYGTFERSTVQHRLGQSWVAFHRLHKFLHSTAVPLRKRVLLWLSTVWSIIQYGLTAVGLDEQAAQRLEAQVFRQLRIVARSPGHVTHESNTQLLKRLGLLHPMDMLSKQCSQRVDRCKSNLQQVQPATVQQWWNLLRSDFQALSTASTQTNHLKEITLQVSFTHRCPHCPQAFPTFHALSVHLGKQHPDCQPKKPSNPTLKNRRKDEYRAHSLQGMPQCKHCLRKFHAWPQFMGHVDQLACSGLKTALALEAFRAVIGGFGFSNSSSEVFYTALLGKGLQVLAM